MRKYRKKAVAKWDFQGDESLEQLSFKKDDVIVVLEVLRRQLDLKEGIYFFISSTRMRNGGLESSMERRASFPNLTLR